jgi:hypothetical protein
MTSTCHHSSLDPEVDEPGCEPGFVDHLADITTTLSPYRYDFVSLVDS